MATEDNNRQNRMEEVNLTVISGADEKQGMFASGQHLYFIRWICKIEDFTYIWDLFYE